MFLGVVLRRNCERYFHFVNATFRVGLPRELIEFTSWLNDVMFGGFTNCSSFCMTVKSIAFLNFVRVNDPGLQKVEKQRQGHSWRPPTPLYLLE